MASASFSDRVPSTEDAVISDKHEPTSFAALLPASRRAKTDHIVTPVPDLEFLEQELLVTRINAIQDWLWTCGRPMPPRPLHHQLVLSREIIVTENPELHLVWGGSRLYLKPLPEYLLDQSFWEAHILQGNGQRHQTVNECARGLLFSYTALVAYKSDFRIACERGLLPETMTWEQWKDKCGQILRGHSYADINPRYWYGELRLNRLNQIYRFRKGFLFRGYTRIAGHAIYGDLVRDNFATLAGILGYVVIVLTAMQVGLATQRLAENEAFQAVSYGFTVFSIIAPLIASVAIVAFVLIWVASNWLATESYEEKRFREMGVVAPWRKQREQAGAC